MNKEKINEIKKAIEDGIPGIKLFVMDSNSMTTAEIQETIKKAQETELKFREKLESLFKQIHNDNIGAPIESYIEEAECICGDNVFVFAKLKARIQKYFDER